MTDTLTKKSIIACSYMYIPYRDKVTVYYASGKMEFYTREEAESQLKQSASASLTCHLENVLNAFPKTK